MSLSAELRGPLGLVQHWPRYVLIAVTESPVCE